MNAIGSRYFLDWLHQQQCSLAFTTYQTGKLFFVGRKSASGNAQPLNENDNALSIFERTYNHCMGMWASPNGQTIWFSSRFQIWRMERAPANAVPYRPSDGAAGDATNHNSIPQWAGRGYDFAYIPRVGYTTGHLDVHDLAVDADGNLVFVNTMFGCLATLSERANFKPIWRPPFISALVPKIDVI